MQIPALVLGVQRDDCCACGAVDGTCPDCRFERQEFQRESEDRSDHVENQQRYEYQP